jgi:hypothetical protein
MTVNIDALINGIDKTYQELVDVKGRRVYEWDAQHGELEEYRASNGEHLGSVEYKTGERLKPAVKGRNIKRYL